jgi:Effector Associated Constant Component 1
MTVLCADARARIRIELAVSEPSQLRPLRELMRGQSDVDVAVATGIPGPGELGALDVLSVVAGSSGMVAAIRTLPDFIRARRSSFRIEATIHGQPFVLNASNVNEVLPVLERLLND